MAKKQTQVDDIVKTMRENGGYATLAYLNRNVDTSNWKTKTPFESIRCYLQRRNEFFKIQPGLWALTDYRDSVLMKFQIKENGKEQIETFTHAYYQGLIVDIGNMFQHRIKTNFFLIKNLGKFQQ